MSLSRGSPTASSFLSSRACVLHVKRGFLGGEGSSSSVTCAPERDVVRTKRKRGRLRGPACLLGWATYSTNGLLCASLRTGPCLGLPRAIPTPQEPRSPSPCLSLFPEQACPQTLLTFAAGVVSGGAVPTMAGPGAASPASSHCVPVATPSRDNQTSPRVPPPPRHLSRARRPVQRASSKSVGYPVTPCA